MKQLIALAVVCTILSLSGAAVALEQGKLTLWISPDKGYKGLAKVAERFTADTGVPVRIAHHDNLERRFQRAASNAQGPD
ncbi:MAG: maltose/maltodextrin ABC transporter substrate-binding protein MalE, partial [Chromatiaceae bacterium]